MSGPTHHSGDKQPIGVLVVEPEALLHPLLHVALEPHGFEVKASLTLSGGLDSLAQDKASLRIALIAGSILGESPEQALAAFWRIKPELPIVVMTGGIINHEPERLFKLGVSQVLRKPFLVADLLRVINLAAAREGADTPTSTDGRSSPENTA